jgi:hypothetical protein
MSDESLASQGGMVREIRIGPAERAYRYRPLRTLTFLMTALKQPPAKARSLRSSPDAETKEAELAPGFSSFWSRRRAS